MAGLAVPPSLQRSLEASKVEYVNLGSSGLRVSWPILGAMSLGGGDMAPWVSNEEDSLQILKAAYDCGINTWDTANVYSNGLSEQVIGRAIRGFSLPRQNLVIMTKCAFCVGDDPRVIGALFAPQLQQSKDYVNQGGEGVLNFVNRMLTNAGLSRTAIFHAVENSLARLGTSYIDLLQIQRYDSSTPPEETMKALHDLVQAGKVRYIGASSMWATQFARLQFLAEKNGWTKFVSMQNYYNLCYREEEREMNRFCKETGVGVIPWAPLFAGKLARPLGRDASIRSKRPSAHHPVVTAEDKSLSREEMEYLEEPYVARPVAGHS